MEELALKLAVPIGDPNIDTRVNYGPSFDPSELNLKLNSLKRRGRRASIEYDDVKF
jgi:hypothetical protein